MTIAKRGMVMEETEKGIVREWIIYSASVVWATLDLLSETVSAMVGY